MEEKESYSPKEVAEIVEAHQKIFRVSESKRGETIEKYRRFVPQNARLAIVGFGDLELILTSEKLQTCIKKQIEKPESMEQKDVYTPAEVAQIVEAYNNIYRGPQDTRQEKLRLYEAFAPQNAVNAIRRRRDFEYYWGEKTPKQRKQIANNWESWCTGSAQFSEFLKFFN
ncbi:MAG: hypothetical protein AABX99_01325 [Nanoarchaeota archaeon]